MCGAQVPGVVDWALRRLDLMQHADKPAGQYSGGNRRRLSAAIALLGAPQLLLLVSLERERERVKHQLLPSCSENFHSPHLNNPIPHTPYPTRPCVSNTPYPIL